jgi:CHAD domain-containing protein
MRRRPIKKRRARRKQPRREIPASTADRLLLQALPLRWRMFLTQLTRCKRLPSEDAVHDLRVAVRRLIAEIDLLSSVTPPSGLKAIRRQLKRLLTALSPLRDTQVQILAIQGLLPAHQDLGSLLTVLRLREQKALKQIGRRLVRLRIRTMREHLNGAARTLRGITRQPKVRYSVGIVLEGSLASSFVRVEERRRRLNAFDPISLHRLRVAFKKFRYLTELLKPRESATLRKAMNSYQTRLGDIHDIEVLLATVREFASRRRGGATTTRVRDIVGVLRRLQWRRRYLARKFVATSREAASFYEYPRH